MTYWKTKRPKPPDSPPSHWIWYWDHNDKEPMILELWPGRYIEHFDGLWGDIVDHPPPRERKNATVKSKKKRKTKLTV